MYIVIIFLTAALFAALAVSLAIKPKHNSSFNSILLLFVTLSGAILYGYGYSEVEPNHFLALVRAVLAVCGMFMGKNDLAVISDVPFFDHMVVKIWFWVAHTGAFYLTASAAITIVGAEALKNLRFALARVGKLVLIFGTEPQEIAYGENRISEKTTKVFFVSDNLSADAEAAISKMGASVRIDNSALHPDKKFLKNLAIRPGKREIEVYALSKDLDANALFAKELLNAMEEAGVTPSQTSISIKGLEEKLSSVLQCSDTKYGYGSVNVFTNEDLAAREMILKCPTWEQMEFDEDCKAKENFEALIIGFGKHGQAALKYLVMNGQFEGSHFKATVFAKDCQSSHGFLKAKAPELFNQYDINLCNADARSYEFYSFLDKYGKNLKYIVVAVSPENFNYELTTEILKYCEIKNISAPIVQCARFGIKVKYPGRSIEKRFPIYCTDTLQAEKLDKRAMLLNYEYMKEYASDQWVAWRNCDYFGRLSNRASADFAPAFLKMSGKELSDIQKNGWNLTDKQLENLGRTEHLRWCAFHFASGYKTMSEAEWQQRAETYLAEVKEKGSSAVRITKNVSDLTHRCLIPWEELINLSKLESDVTGKNVDYIEADYRNVRMLPTLLEKENSK